GAYLPQGKQGICLGRHFSGGQQQLSGVQRRCPQKKGWQKRHTQHRDQVGSERGCGLLDGVCRA
ncbi:unnamed protein product, partial [Staurois parvus]